MKRIVLITLAFALLAGQAKAAPYYMDATTAAQMTSFSVVGGSDTGSLLYVGYNPGALGDRVFGTDEEYYDAMTYAVGFSGRLADTSTDGDDVATAIIGMGSLDLGGSYDAFALPLSNDDNQTWQYRSYATIGGTTYYSDGGAWTTLAAEQNATLIATFNGLVSSVQGIGFEIQWNRGLNGGSGSDDFHTSVVPVPAGVVLGILGLGVVGWKLRRFA